MRGWEVNKVHVATTMVVWADVGGWKETWVHWRWTSCGRVARDMNAMEVGSFCALALERDISRGCWTSPLQVTGALEVEEDTMGALEMAYLTYNTPICWPTCGVLEMEGDLFHLH